MDILEVCKKYQDRINQLNELLEYPEFNVDYRFSKRYLDEIASLNKIVELYNLYLESNDGKILNKIKNELLNKYYDNYSGITITLENSSTALINLYKKFFENGGYEVHVEKDRLEIRGVNLYSLYKEETGMHEMFGDKIGQSVKVTVLPIIDNFKELDLKDVKVDVFHSSGAGGQNINKVETAVRLTHIPTNIVVTCQDERSQLQNKNKAIALLKEKVEKYYKDLADKETAKIAKNIKYQEIRHYYLTNRKVEDLRLNKTYSMEDFKQFGLREIASELLINGRS